MLECFKCFQDARLGPVIARALTSDVCSRINVALSVAIAGGRLSDFTYSLYVFVLLVHSQVTIIFVVSVCLSVCLFVCLFVCAEFFSAVLDPIWIKLGHMLHVRV